MIALPNCVGGIAECAGASANYATDGVRVIELADGLFRLEATDGKVAAIVRGPCPSVEGVPVFPIPDGVDEAIVPLSTWKEAFTRFEPVVLCMGGGKVSASTTGHVETAPAVTGRWPNIEGVMPRPDAYPRAVIRVDPRSLIRLLQLAADIQPGGCENAVTLIVWSDQKPLGVTAIHDGITVDGIILPVE